MSDFLPTTGKKSDVNSQSVAFRPLARYALHRISAVLRPHQRPLRYSWQMCTEVVCAKGVDAPVFQNPRRCLLPTRDGISIRS